MSQQKLPTRRFEWTPELAYAVGLITTDGCLSPDGRHIMLTSSDLDQLETFKTCLGIKNKIGLVKNTDGITSQRVQFGNIQLYNLLTSIGLFPNKTYSVGAIKMPEKFFRDFLRGHLDGDGTITTYTDRHNTFKNPKYVYTRIFLRFISASHVHIEWLQQMAIKNLRVRGRIHKIKPRGISRVPIYTLKFGKKESIKALEQIYYSDSIPFLKRKYLRYKKFIEN